MCQIKPLRLLLGAFILSVTIGAGLLTGVLGTSSLLIAISWIIRH